MSFSSLQSIDVTGVGGRQKLCLDKGTVEPLQCLLYRAGPPCIAAVVLRRLLCGEKIHRKLFLSREGETDSEGNKCRVAATMADLS